MVANRPGLALVSCLLASSLMGLPAATGQLGGQPDLVVFDLTWSPPEPVEGQSTTFTAHLENRGNQDVLQPFTVSFTFNGQEIVPARTVQGLAAGSRTTVTSAGRPAAEGENTITAKADAGGTVDESDEANNERTETFDAPAATRDLIVTGLQVSPQTPGEGQSTTFTASVTNDGNAGSGSFLVRFFVDDQKFGNDKEVSNVPGGGTVNVTSDAWTAVIGTHKIGSWADAPDPIFGTQVDETDETNNRLNTTVTVGPGGPDLVMEEITWAPVTPRPGESVRFTALVTNQGTQDAGLFNVRFVLDGATLGMDKLVTSLAAGASTAVTSDPWSPATVGNHTIVAQPDFDDQLDETDDTNNNRTETFAVGPDLVVADITWATVPVGGSTNFTAVIRNAGSSPAAAFRVRFVLDGVQLGPDRNVTGLDPHTDVNVTSTNWAVTLGNHQIRAVADVSNAVAETHEGNNARQEPFTVAETRPDLVLLDIAFAANPRAGDSLGFAATVKNQGNSTATNVTVRFALDAATSLGDKTIATLAPGASSTVTSNTWTATGGTHTIRAEADPANTIAEVNETNNARQESLIVESAPAPPQPGGTIDLAIPSVVVPPSVVDGDTVTFLASIRNDGNANAGAFGVRFLLDGASVLGQRSISGLSAGASTTVSSDAWPAVAGTHTLTVMVDVDNSVTETNEANNEATVPFAVAAPPDEPAPPPPEPTAIDLTVVDLIRSEVEGSEDRVVFIATVRNAGTTAAGPFSVRFVVDEEILGDKVVEGLAPGATTTVVSDEWEMTRGDHVAIATADPRNQVTESNEGNNEARIEFEGPRRLPLPALPLLLVPVLALARRRRR